MPWTWVKKKHWYHYRSLWVLLILLLVGALVGPRAKRRYDRWSSDRHVQRARDFHAKGDFTHAMLDARAALERNPHNPEANRILAQTLESAGSPDAVLWRSRLDSLLPSDPENLLAWAGGAVKAGDLSTAERAIKKLPPSVRNARYHDIAAAIAMGKRDLATAEANWTEAARLDPSEDRYAVNIATLRLGSKSPEIRAGALQALDKVTAKSAIAIQARRTLLGDAMRQKDAARSKELADALVADPAATFADKLLRLTTLRAVGDNDSSSYLEELQKAAAAAPEELPRMLDWMHANDLALLATDWLATLPPDILAKPPVCISVAETYVKAGQWSRLRESVGKGNWMEADYLRRAFLALALDRSKEPEAGATEWKQAIAAAQSSPGARGQFELLAKLALDWRWKERAEELLWKIAAFPNPPKWVLDSLWAVAMQRGDTAHLQMVAGMMARMNFQDLAIRNNYIFLSLLTRTEEGNPHRAAEALHKDYPDNAYVTSTYGLSLYQQGKPEEAAAIMGALKPEDLRQPQLALYHGIFLTAAGQREKAEEFLKLAADWPMLPEEKALLDRVKTAAADAAAAEQEKKSGTKNAGNPAASEKN